MRELLFICSALLISTGVFAQQDSVETEPPRPRLYVLLDYGKIATLPTSFESKYEGGLGIRITRNIFLVGHVGHARLVPNNAIENGTYTSQGLYYRVGFDHYFNIDQKNTLSVGARYGMSTFDEELSYLITSDLFEDINETVTRTGITAQWAELSIGSEAHLGEGPFYIGGYFSLRVLVSRDEFDPTDTYTIPGYGRTFDKTIPSLQLYLKWAIF